MPEYGTTRWGQSWLRLAEPTTVTGIDTRLPRARALARQDRVTDLHLSAGRITATIHVRNTPLQVTLTVPLWPRAQQSVITKYLAAHPAAATSLTSGDAPDALADLLTPGGVAPPPDELEVNCPCREPRRPCLHALACLYAVTQRLDEEPALALTLRGHTPPEPDWIPLHKIDPRHFYEAPR
ncbi:putative Zn finger protein [Crossiella equi]|uniref:Zn finger protein n=1 Tax=Crossiella equi TaxID=130796 RepID=A0ABS5AS63_9PSEU|nr:hypothetical protein [Crossiella equi]MBP2479429.1 putative Zn finger protein [Crossiella equi]